MTGPAQQADAFILGWKAGLSTDPVPMDRIADEEYNCGYSLGRKQKMDAVREVLSRYGVNLSVGLMLTRIDQ